METDPDQNLSVILNQHIWNNRHIKVQKASIFYKEFAKLQINKIIDLADKQGNFNWGSMQQKGVEDKYYLKWAGIVHSIPREWKICIKQNQNLIEKITRYGQNILMRHSKLDIMKISSKSIYNELIEEKFSTPTAQANLSKRIPDVNIDWEKVYNRIYTTTIDTYLRMFQYKILNNTLFLKKELHRFGIVHSPSCSLCHSYPETIDHLFINCIEAKNYYFTIKEWLKQFGIKLPNLNKVNILLGVDDNFINFVILIYKYSLFKTSKGTNVTSLNTFINLLTRKLN